MSLSLLTAPERGPAQRWTYMVELWGQPCCPLSGTLRQGSCPSTRSLPSARRALSASSQKGQDCKKETLVQEHGSGRGACTVWDPQALGGWRSPRPLLPAGPTSARPRLRQAPPRPPPPPGPASVSLHLRQALSPRVPLSGLVSTTPRGSHAPSRVSPQSRDPTPSSVPTHTLCPCSRPRARP